MRLKRIFGQPVMAPIDTGLDFLRQALALRDYRQEILSADIANASTPGFKAVDLDFAAALRAASGRPADRPTAHPDRPTWQVDDRRHLAPATPVGQSSIKAAAADFVDDQSSSPGLDGNSVDLDQVKLAAAANAVDYAAAATFATQTIRLLMTAIGGAAAPQSGGA